MIRNITLSAEESLIEAARHHAQEENSTLNQAFRDWLKSYSHSVQDAENKKIAFNEIMNQLAYVSTGNRKYSRDELNER